MARSSVYCVRKFSTSADEVWDVLGTFDVSWHPAVAQCDLLRSAEGTLVRCFSDQDGNLYEEQRNYVSDTDRTLCYTLTKGISGLLKYSARVEVTQEEDGALVTWTANIIASADRAEEVAKGTRSIFEAGLDALQDLPKSNSVARPNLHAEIQETQAMALDGLPKINLRLGAPSEHESDTLVLFLHGIGGNATNWDTQLSQLGTQYRVAAMDLRGYGGSTLGFEPTQMTDYCEDILQVQKHLGVKRLVLVGLSYGSWIATSFAMRHSDKLAGLVLSGGCTGMSEADPKERENFRVSREVPLDAGQTPSDFAPAVIDIIAGPNASEKQRQEMLNSMAAIPSATYRDALQCFTNPLERFDFAKIDCPVLLFTGEHDKLAPPSEIRRVSERVLEERQNDSRHADVQFEMIPGAGHICNLEAPEMVNNLLHRFLSRLPKVARDYKANVQERQREKRERIRQAAHDEFCENGFDGASMDRIAVRADVSKPTLYQYFGGKEGLLEAVLDTGRMQIVAPLMAKEGAFAEQLWNFAWSYAHFVLRPDMLSLARLILGEASRRPEAAIAYHQNGPARAFEGLVEFIREAESNGKIITDAPDLTSNDLWSLILSGPRDHYLHYANERPTEQELLRSIGHGLKVFLKAYSAEPELEIAVLEILISVKTESLTNGNKSHE